MTNQTKPSPLTAYQPFRTLWTAASVFSLLVRVPFWALYYVPRSLRQKPSWTWAQAMEVTRLRWLIRLITDARFQLEASAHPGPSEESKEEFALVPPAPKHLLTGVAAPESYAVQPAARPVAWYPSPYDAQKDKGIKVILFFFGGAYVVGSYQPSDVRGGLDLLLPAIGGPKWCAVGYRLASTAGHSFPAQLQDAVGAYQYLLEVGVPASDVILYGSSAGAGICLSLLRYLTEYPDVPLPLPAAGILDCPWVDLTTTAEEHGQHRNYDVDMCEKDWLEWGANAVAPAGMSRADPYLSPALKPFQVKVPLFVATDDGELFVDAILKFGKDMQNIPGNDVQIFVNEKGMHAGFLSGKSKAWIPWKQQELEQKKAFLLQRGLISAARL